MKNTICIKTLFIVVSIFYIPLINNCLSIEIELQELRFFKSADEIPDRQNRDYERQFNPETQYINIELNIKNLKFNVEDKEYKTTFIWKYFNGEEFGRTEAVFNVKSEWETAYMNRGWGFSEKGNWRLGRFTAQVLINDSLFAEKDFYITPFGKEFLDLPEDNKPIEELQNLPPSINSEIIQQYKIVPVPFFNYFYDINFNHDGSKIAYTMANYEHISSSQGSTTTSYKYLFVNNKQIIPDYFALRYNFDDNFQNLAYFGLKLTSTNINEADGFGYYNGLQLYKSVNFLPISISPDNQKYCYIMNTMPYLKSSFTWDAGYEFIMLNNEKVQPEELKIAKSIRISKSTLESLEKDNSVVFRKNKNNIYDAVYTAKYRFDKDMYYAQFNESERESEQFDGYISKPYLSANKKSIAYLVQDKKMWFILLDNQVVTQHYDNIKHNGSLKRSFEEILFSETDDKVIYQIKNKGDWYVVKGDEIISEGFSKIESISVFPGGRKIAYKAKTGKKWAVYINKTKVSDDFEAIGDDIAFSPDGAHVAYAAGQNETMFVLIDKQKVSADYKIFYKYSMYMGEQPLAITNITLNKSGDKVAYVCVDEFSGDQTIEKMQQSYVMINDLQVSPKMYNATLFSKNPGEFFYAGIDMADLIVYHVKLNF